MWIPSLVSSPTCNGFFRFTSGATPADLLVASMAAKPFDSHTYIQALVGIRVQDQACCCLIACDKTDTLPTELRQHGTQCKTKLNENAFQWDAYCPLVDHIPACTVQVGCLPRGVGVSAQGECLPGGVSATPPGTRGRHPPPPVDRQTPVKT